MSSLQSAVNPFALMIDPQSVLAAIESSERLSRLHSRICRPLDKPMIGHAGADEARAFDDAVEAAADAGTEAADDLGPNAPPDDRLA